ncbi:hypothetical protein Anapl_12580 [Anas platyrhynchos]|uniref:Transmembrane protein 238 n=1 Tax=Anas platyrhynchos TaxID=8839 RepID=R0KK35_ANAPL|nr:hypothetical protein Anapl_12580 [Anas platyrhynchos]
MALRGLAGRCAAILLLALLCDVVGLILLLLGIFAPLSYWDFLVYMGSLLLAFSLVFWVFWYTFNIENPTEVETSMCRVSTAADGVLPPSWCPKGMFLLTNKPVSSRCLGTTPRGNGCKVPITTCPHYHDCQAHEDPWEAVVPMGCDLLVHFPLCNLSALRCSPVCVALGRVELAPQNVAQSIPMPRGGINHFEQGLLQAAAGFGHAQGMQHVQPQTLLLPVPSSWTGNVPSSS